MTSALDFYDKRERPWPVRRLDRAAIIGHTTETTTRLWLRLKTPGRYCLCLAEEPFYDSKGDPALTHEGGVDYLRTETATHVVWLPLHTFLRFEVTADTDFTRVIDLTGLTANTRYHYAVFRESWQEERARRGEGAIIDENPWELGIEQEYSFQTLSDRDTSFSFGLFSCHMPFKDDSIEGVDVGMWTDFHNELELAKARFVIGAGDQVYADGNDRLSIWRFLKKHIDEQPTLADMISWYRDVYRGYWGFAPLRRVFSSFPCYMTWDDHEIMDGWGSFTDAELASSLNRSWRRDDAASNLRLAQKMFTAAQHVYCEYQHAHNPQTPAGVYDYSMAPFGCDFYVLDLRGQRSFARPRDRILGAAQHARFQAWRASLASSGRSGPIFIVSSVPTVHLRDFVIDATDRFNIQGGRDDVRDHWAHGENKAEISRLFDGMFMTAEQTGRPLVILSGDVHIATIFSLRHPAYPKARVFQVTSSAITYATLSGLTRTALRVAVRESGNLGSSKITFRLHNLYAKNNFAILSVRTDHTRTTRIVVELIGQAEGRVGQTERERIDLLALNT